MKRSIRDKWVAALRSGAFKQGKGSLCSIVKDTDEKYYCCLGVLCEVLEWKRVNDEFDATNLVRLVGVNYLDPHATELCGDDVWISGMIPNTTADAFNFEPHQLANLNDNQGYDFNRIADFIEKNVSVEED